MSACIYLLLHLVFHLSVISSIVCTYASILPSCLPLEVNGHPCEASCPQGHMSSFTGSNAVWLTLITDTHQTLPSCPGSRPVCAALCLFCSGGVCSRLSWNQRVDQNDENTFGLRRPESRRTTPLLGLVKLDMTSNPSANDFLCFEIYYTAERRRDETRRVETRRAAS